MPDPVFPADSATLTGTLLLAFPGIGDPRFERSAIAMCVHNADGALGIGVGHLRSGVRFHDVLEEVGLEPGAAPDVPVHQGGPVEPGRGFVLHSPEWTTDGTLAVNDLFSLTASLEVIRAITEGRGPQRWLFALGYAGWGPGQLDGEMQRHGWYVSTARGEVLFDRPAESRWAAAWKADGIDPALLASETGRA